MSADQRKNVEKLLIQKFNAEARPLSSGALHSLSSFVLESRQSAEQVVQDLLSQLTVGALASLHGECEINSAQCVTTPSVQEKTQLLVRRILIHF